ncbi:alkaline phosphatase family protein [Embleya sp. NPDC127516]|uniref:alkaline phosphatase family protein n=1 Tax=Embleya sp. NPDC127516 TaxID=3363990 RepID=UPI00381C714F
MYGSTRAKRGIAAAAVAAVAVPLALAGAALAASPAAAETLPSLPGGTKKAKTLVIGIDGLRFDKLRSGDAPNLKALMAGGVTASSNLYAQPFAPTVSGPGWSTIATGVWPDKHGVHDNSFAGSQYDKYPDFATRLETAQPAASTLVVGAWEPISSKIFSPKVDVRVSTDENDDLATADTAQYLSTGNPDVAFMHLDAVDGAGHNNGGSSVEYAQAVREADTRVGRVLDALRGRATYAQEDWLIMVTTDHGHTDSGGHGGDTPQERQTFVIANGGGMPAGTVRDDVRLVDIAPTVLKHEGVRIDPAWGLDGQPIDEIKADAFDALRPTLSERVDETGIPAGVKGFTHTTPQGWSIDNSAMPTGGVTEWRGWSFTTDEFFTRAEGNAQAREGNVRSRNVFAVADSDEWDDKAHAAGQFDSTLVSPAYPVEGKAKAELSYVSDYQVDGPQTGDVYVSWDGGAPKPIKSYRANTNQVERLTLDVPAGAETAQIRFRYTGTNSRFWAIDQVSLTTSGATNPGGDPLSGNQVITTTVKNTGGLTMTVDGGTVTLPSPELTAAGDRLASSGALNTVQVTDLRTADPGWNVSGQVTDFAAAGGAGGAGFDGSALGWTPKVVRAGDGQQVTAGPPVAPAADGGVKTARTLGRAVAGHGRGTAVLGADLSLNLATTTAPGTYSATLTVTAI